MFVNTSASMENTVATGETIVVEKCSFGLSTRNLPIVLNTVVPYRRLVTFRLPRRSETIVFRHTGKRDDASISDMQLYMKRCIAIAGDVVEVRNGSVYVNGMLMEKPSTAAATTVEPTLQLSIDEEQRYQTFPSGLLFTSHNWGPMRVPSKGDTLVMDADGFHQWQTFVRAEGHDVDVDAQSIDGTAASVYVVERDYIFVLGDNRENSLDSRFIGFVAADDVIGTPLMVVRSTDPETGNIAWNRIGTIIH